LQGFASRLLTLRNKLVRLCRPLQGTEQNAWMQVAASGATSSFEFCLPAVIRVAFFPG
jgi:hypothetical protein